MSDPVHFLFRADQLGGHVHVAVWAGTQQQAENQARPKLGTLVMDPDQWEALRCVIGGIRGDAWVTVEAPGERFTVRSRQPDDVISPDDFAGHLDLTAELVITSDRTFFAPERVRDALTRVANAVEGALRDGRCVEDQAPGLGTGGDA